MSLELRQRIFAQLDALALIDPHTHVNPLQPASRTLADILGYHYYTELAHSGGMARADIEEAGLDPKEQVGRLIARLGPIDNTIQYSWLIELCQQLFGFTDHSINVDNWEALYDRSAAMMAAPDWAHQVMAKSKLEGLLLTNDFDDPLEGFDNNTFIPCLRTDDLVFHLSTPEVQQRLAESTGVDVTSAAQLRYAISGLFHYFKEQNARACAISLPPDFAPTPISDARADTAIAAIYRDGASAHESHRKAATNFVFWTLAQLCAEYRLPFDLMIGVHRNVYADGVHQGRDLYDSRVSLYQYKDLFNAFPQVTFPISVLASSTNQELASYAWIFPNVVTNGHWWYSNTPTFIEHDCAARLEAVPRTKQIGYYSDAYKLEFALPKFAMYKRVLAKVLAERFVIDRRWSEEQAVALGQQILRGNVDTIFAATPMPVYVPPPEEPAAEPAVPVVQAAELPPVAVPTDDDSAFATPFAGTIESPGLGVELPLGEPAKLDVAESFDFEDSLEEPQLMEGEALADATPADSPAADELASDDLTAIEVETIETDDDLFSFDPDDKKGNA
jgi:glucuronate isomerase